MRLTAMIRTVLVMIALLLTAAPGRAAEGNDRQLADLIAGMLKAYGGEAAVARVEAVAARGEIVDFLNGNRGAYGRYFARPRRLRIEIMPDQGGEVRLLDGSRGWQGTGRQLVKAQPVLLQSMVYQYSYLDLPMAFAHHSFPVSYGGRVTLGERELALVLVDPPGSPQIRVYVDPATFLIARVSADFAMGMMGSSELATEYGDYRPAAGVLFPRRLTNYAGTLKLSEITLSSLEVNPGLPAALFAPAP